MVDNLRGKHLAQSLEIRAQSLELRPFVQLTDEGNSVYRLLVGLKKKQSLRDGRYITIIPDDVSKAIEEYATPLSTAADLDIQLDNAMDRMKSTGSAPVT